MSAQLAILPLREFTYARSEADAKRDTQINSLTVAVAVTEVTVKSVDKKLDELGQLIRRKLE